MRKYLALLVTSWPVLLSIGGINASQKRRERKDVMYFYSDLSYLASLAALREHISSVYVDNG